MRWTKTLFFLLLIFMYGCATNSGFRDDSKVNVLATTTIIADVVQQVAGDHIELQCLLPYGTSPHGFEPTPRDLALISEADIIFINGFGLEESLMPYLHSVSEEIRIVDLSDTIQPRMLAGNNEEPADEHAHTEQHHHHEIDPHVWMNPMNIRQWTETIYEALCSWDSLHTDDPIHDEFLILKHRQYRYDIQHYWMELGTLDNWIQEQVQMIPEDQRLLVTDHRVFGYFSDRYGFTQVGAILPGFSSLAQPSARELAQLEEAIHEYQVPFILVGNTINPALAQRIAEDTGTNLVPVYTGSLSLPDGEAATYIQYMRFNVNAIVSAIQSE